MHYPYRLASLIVIVAMISDSENEATSTVRYCTINDDKGQLHVHVGWHREEPEFGRLVHILHTTDFAS